MSIPTIVLFDIDDTLLFRREIYGQYDLHRKQIEKGLVRTGDSYIPTVEKVYPRPDRFFEEAATLVYIRPGAKEALDYARKKAHKVCAFSASADPKWILEQTGLLHHFDKVFGREHTAFAVKDGQPVCLKRLESIRRALNLDPADKVYMLDDRPEWIIASTANDHIVPVAPFMPAYKLYDVQVIKASDSIPDPTDRVSDETVLLDTLLHFL